MSEEQVLELFRICFAVASRYKALLLSTGQSPGSDEALTAWLRAARKLQTSTKEVTTND